MQSSISARSGRSWSRSSRPASDRKSTRLNSSHMSNSYAVFCLKKKKLSLDAIKENKLLIATFNVRQIGFVGGLVNTVTNSCTNQFQVSAFGYGQNYFFFDAAATTEIYTLSLHDALPI